jgi:hypothetical protein
MSREVNPDSPPVSAFVGWAPPTDLKPLVQVNSAMGGAHPPKPGNTAPTSKPT